MGFLKNKITMVLGALVALVLMGLAAAMPGADVSAKTVEVNSAKYGYGKYTITARGEGMDGVYSEDTVVFYYLPVYASIEQDANGDQYLKLDYGTDDGSGEGGEGGGEEDDGLKKVAKVEIKICDENGNPIPGIPAITVYPPTTEVPLSGYFDNYDLPSGSYQIKVTAYDKDGEELYEPYVVKVTYDSDEDILVPDTGSFYQGLNITKVDYLVTALIAFAIITIPGMFIILKKDKKTNRKAQ